MTREISSAKESERGSSLLRFLDRWVGIPAVLGLGLMRARGRALPAEVRSIGVLKTAAIGDTTLLSAVLRDLRQAYPSARLSLFVGRSNLSVARLLGTPDRVIGLPLKDMFAARRCMLEERFDLFLDFGPWPRINALLTHLADASYKVGFRTPGQYRHYGYDLAVPHSSSQHELENYRDILRAVGLVPTNQPGFPASVGSQTPRLTELTKPYVVFHLWPGGYKAYMKEWPAERWVELGMYFAAAGFRVALTGAPADRGRNDQVIAMAGERGSAQGWSNCSGMAIEETIAVLRRARLVVSVNTGVMHMAAALDRPVVGLHGPTSAIRWGPVGANSVAISSPKRGCGYLNLGFEYPRHCDCMEAIAVEAVLETCERYVPRSATNIDDR